MTKWLEYLLHSEKCSGLFQILHKKKKKNLTAERKGLKTHFCRLHLKGQCTKSNNYHSWKQWENMCAVRGYFWALSFSNFTLTRYVIFTWLVLYTIYSLYKRTVSNGLRLISFPHASLTPFDIVAYPASCGMFAPRPITLFIPCGNLSYDLV